MTTIQGSGPANRLVDWLNENPPPERWAGSELMWARSEMPLVVMLEPEERWPGPLAWIQAQLRRGDLLRRFHVARQLLETETVRFNPQPRR